MRSPEPARLVSNPEFEALSAALRALPQVAPESSSWNDIEAQLIAAGTEPAARALPRRRWPAIAAAASVALAIFWLRFLTFNPRLRKRP